MLRTMKYRSGSWQRSAFHNKKRSTNTGRSMKNWTKSAKLSIIKTRCWRTNSTTWTSLLSKNTKRKKARTQSSLKKFKNGSQDIRPVKKVRPKNSKISEIWWRAKGNRWLIGKSGRWPSVSKIKDQVWRMKSGSAESYSRIEIEKSTITSKNVRNTRSLLCNWEIIKISSVIMRINWPYSIKN